jgi:hypothetical protein
VANHPAFYSAVGDLIDALSDELAHEVCFAPEVRDRVAHVIGFLGDNYQSYLTSWWLIDAVPTARDDSNTRDGSQS